MLIRTWFIVFIVSLYILIKASDYFTDSAEKIGLAFGIPDFVVGITIVALGTSLPEVISSIIAVAKDSSEIVIGNVIGSNVTNIFLIIGVTGIIAKRVKIAYELIHIDLPLLMGSALFLAITVWDGRFTLFEAILCLVGFAVYLLHAMAGEKETKGGKTSARGKRVKQKEKISGKSFFVLALSAIFIYVGGRYTIESIINISMLLNIGKEVMAASIT